MRFGAEVLDIVIALHTRHALRERTRARLHASGLLRGAGAPPVTDTAAKAAAGDQTGLPPAPKPAPAPASPPALVGAAGEGTGAAPAAPAAGEPSADARSPEAAQLSPVAGAMADGAGGSTAPGAQKRVDSVLGRTPSGLVSPSAAAGGGSAEPVSAPAGPGREQKGPANVSAAAGRPSASGKPSGKGSKPGDRPWQGWAVYMGELITELGRKVEVVPALGAEGSLKNAKGADLANDAPKGESEHGALGEGALVAGAARAGPVDSVLRLDLRMVDEEVIGDAKRGASEELMIWLLSQPGLQLCVMDSVLGLGMSETACVDILEIACGGALPDCLGLSNWRVLAALLDPYICWFRLASTRHSP